VPPVSRGNEARSKMAIIAVYQLLFVCPVIVLEATEYMLGILSSPISYLQRLCWWTKAAVMKVTPGLAIYFSALA
jgi:hypothetical protein